MVRYETPKFGPKKTPRAMRILLWSFVAIAVGCSILTQILVGIVDPYTPDHLLSLSAWGLRHYFLWQLISYLGVISSSFSVLFVVILLFELYLIWVVGTALIEHVGQRQVIGLFLLSGLLAGIAAAIVLLTVNGVPPLSGAMPSIFALLMGWTMFNPQLRMLLMLSVPLQIKWLVLGLFGLNVLLDLSSEAWASLAANCVGLLTGYFYALICWRLKSPFGFSQGFEKWVLSHLPHKRQVHNSKIYDIRGGRRR